MIIFFLFILIGSFYVYQRRNELSFRIKLVPVSRKIRKVADIFYLPYYFKANNLPTYELTIDPQDLKKLDENLPPAFSDQILTSEYKKTRSAALNFDGITYNVKVRYRGDLSNHWSHPKKSWHFIIKGGKLLNGMSRINFTIPEDRDFILEDFNNWRARQMGLLVPHTELVNLKINGKNYGVYWLHEHWTKEMLSKAGLPDGANIYGTEDGGNEFGRWKPVFDSSSFWKKYTKDEYSGFDNYADIDTLLALINNPDDNYFYQNIFNIIDEENFFKWQIHSTLVASDHQNYWNNMRLYFNPVIGKFQFIPWDVALWPPGDAIDKDYNPLVTRILKNPKLRLKRDTMLWQYIGNPEVAKEYLKKYDELWLTAKTAIFQDRMKAKNNLQVERIIKQNRKWLQDNFGFIKQQLQKSRVMSQISYQPQGVALGIKLQVETVPPLLFKNIIIESENYLNLPLQVYYDTNNNSILDDDDLLVGKFQKSDGFFKAEINQYLYSDLTLNGDPMSWVQYQQRQFSYLIVGAVDLDPRITNVKLDIVNYLTQEKINNDKEELAGGLFSRLSDINLSRGQFLKKYTQFSGGEGNEVVLAGIQTFNKDVIIPAGLLVKILPGTILYFGKGVSLFSYAKVLALGVRDNPIVITGIDGQLWGVFLVTGKEARGSRFEFVRMRGSGQDYLNGIFASGGLAIHNVDDITIANSEFRDSRGDDAVNLKYASGVVEQNTFVDASSDALDIDFGSPEIKNNLFINSGNDAIDVSYSRSFISGNTIKAAGDKGISVGETSEVVIFDNSIEKTAIGIAVKDLSQANIVNNTLFGNKQGVSLYQKKKVFGPATAKLYNNILWDDEPLVVSKGSTADAQNNNMKRDYPPGNVSINPRFFPEASRLLLAPANDQQLLQGGKQEFLKGMVDVLPAVVPLGIIN